MFKKLRRFFRRLIPSYRIGNTIRLENKSDQQELKQRLDQLDYKMEYLFWLSQKHQEETMAETKRRVFLSMPEAEGKSRLVQQMNHKILKHMKQVCDENGLRIFLAFGSLLGAVRNQGFIPWDDDIDVAMLRLDCERLMTLLQNDPVLRADNCYSIMYEKFIKVKFRDLDKFFVDIFVMDEFSADDSNLEERYKEIRAAHWEYAAEMKRYFAETGERIEDYAVPKPNAALNARMEAKFKALSERLGYYGKGNYLGFGIDDNCLMTNTWYSYPKDELLKPAQVRFDGEIYETFGNYPQWLTNAYGDYWNLPKNIMTGHSEFAELEAEDYRAMATHGVLTAQEAESWISNGNKFQAKEVSF
ncbi:MAG: LicD family protein [Oscillospiraceae bacterium]|nr:LicD family protein [Oscillospiraceae bacterium]